MNFGQILDATEENFIVEDRVTIYMSPQHMKAVAQLLVSKVAEYEQTFGDITLPESLLLKDQ